MVVYVQACQNRDFPKIALIQNMQLRRMVAPRNSMSSTVELVPVPDHTIQVSSQNSTLELRIDQRPSATNCTKVEATGQVSTAVSCGKVGGVTPPH